MIQIKVYTSLCCCISSNDNILKVNKYKEKSENDVQDKGFFGDLVE